MKAKKIILYSLFLFGVFVFFKLVLSHHFSYRESGLNTVLKSERSDILIIGSSHVRFSYDAELIEKKCNCSVQTVSYSYLDYSLIYEILRLFKDKNLLPRKKLIIDHYSLMFLKKRDFIDTRLFFDAPFSLKKKILAHMFQSFKKVTFQDLYRFVISSNNEILLTYPVNRPLVDSRSYNGSYKRKTIKGMKEEDYNALQISKNHFDFNNVRDDEIKTLLNLNSFMKEAVNSYVFLETPLPAPISNNQELQTFINKQKSLYQEQSLPFIYSNDYFNEMELYSESFMDDNHLSTFGREQFSKFLENILSTL
ncbi:MAG: hypothetical protein ACPGJV_13925 [Bacteriovoracaceae bacterium]